MYYAIKNVGVEKYVMLNVRFWLYPDVSSKLNM